MSDEKETTTWGSVTMSPQIILMTPTTLPSTTTGSDLLPETASTSTAAAFTSSGSLTSSRSEEEGDEDATRETKLKAMGSEEAPTTSVVQDGGARRVEGEVLWPIN
jgi:hypothetical protein